MDRLVTSLCTNKFEMFTVPSNSKTLLLELVVVRQQFFLGVLSVYILRYSGSLH